MANKKTVLVTGANRGIGREIAKELAEMDWQVIATARSQAKAQEAAAAAGNGAIGLAMNVNDEDSVKQAAAFVMKNFTKLDVLVNNAGIIGNSPLLDFNLSQISGTMETNFMGPIRTSKYFMPLLRKSEDSRIINISSGMGELASLQQGGYGAYRLSKAALNTFTIMLAAELKHTSVKAVAMCPGWVKTDMGGTGATRSVDKGAETAVWLAASKEIQSGKSYRDKKVISW